jgi:two-component system chemotaxis sensor kinase CheA
VASRADITDNEFEQLLDSLNAVKAEAEAPAAAPARRRRAASDEITDAEFESLLDQLHGKGQFAADAVAPTAAPPAPATDGSDITDDEFEALLDQLHGKGTLPSMRWSRPSLRHHRRALKRRGADGI